MHTEEVVYFDGAQQLLGKLMYQSGPDFSQRRPAVMVFHAFEGRSDFALECARKYAEQGYIAFAVDIYGDAATSDTIEGCYELVTPFLQDRSLVRKRACLAYETLKQNPLVHPAKIGALGFCFGGMCVLELMRSGAPLTAGVGCHSVLAKSTLPTENISGKLLLLQGYQDPQVPALPNLDAFAQEMADAQNNDWTFTYFGDVKHSYTDPKTGHFDPEREKKMGREYNPRAAARAFSYADSFFKEWLAAL